MDVGMEVPKIIKNAICTPPTSLVWGYNYCYPVLLHEARRA